MDLESLVLKLMNGRLYGFEFELFGRSMVSISVCRIHTYHHHYSCSSSCKKGKSPSIACKRISNPSSTPNTTKSSNSNINDTPMYRPSTSQNAHFSTAKRHHCRASSPQVFQNLASSRSSALAQLVLSSGSSWRGSCYPH